MRKVFKFLAVLLVFLIAGCSSSTSTESPSGDKKISVAGVNAELGNETVLIPEAVVESALIESDTENGRYSFSADVINEGNIDLNPGEILLIAGVGLGRITSVREENGQVKVETGYASLNEAFKEADIEWERSFEFTPDILESAVIEFQGKQFESYTLVDGKYEWEIKSGPYEGKASIEPKGSSAIVVVGLRKQEGNTGVAFKAETTIQQIANYTNVEIRDHTTRKFEFINPNMGGSVELELAAAGGGLDQNIGIGPLTMLKIPFTIGPIPVVLAVKVRTVARVEVYGNSSAVANTKFSYNGSAGLTYDGTSVSTDFDNAIANPTHGGGSGDLAAAIGLNVDAQWGFAAPEVELQMFGNTVVPYIRPEFFLRAHLSWGPVCQRLSAEYKVSSGLDVRFLGVASASIFEHDIVPLKDWKAYSPENCANKIIDGDPAQIYFPKTMEELSSEFLVR